MQDSLLEIGRLIAAVPQLGSTASIAGSAIAFAARRIANNQEMPSGRYIFSLEEKLIPNYSDPAENEKNEKAGENAWKKISLETSCLDFATLFDIAGKTNPVVAYACANLYSPDGQPLVLNYMHGGVSRFWFNGKALYTSNPGANQAARLRLSPVKGWNRLVIKVSATGYVRPVIFGALPGEYESKNIAWTAGLPAPGYGSPQASNGCGACAGLGLECREDFYAPGYYGCCPQNYCLVDSFCQPECTLVDGKICKSGSWT